MSKGQVDQLHRIGMLAIVQNRCGVVTIVESYGGRNRCITEKTMPAIASFDHFKAAQKKGLGIYAMPYLSSRAETNASGDALYGFWLTDT